MKIIEHGQWHNYKPTRPHPHAPLNTLYLRRKDGKDWYELAHSKDYFKKGSILVTCSSMYGKWVTMVATTDPSRLFPINQLLLELQGAIASDPQKRYEHRIYTPGKQMFGDKVDLLKWTGDATH